MHDSADVFPDLTGSYLARESAGMASVDMATAKWTSEIHGTLEIDLLADISWKREGLFGFLHASHFLVFV